MPELQNLALVRSTRGVVNLVRAGCELIRVPPAVIAALKARQDPQRGVVRLEPVCLEVGQRARLFDGPLAGLEGILQERCGVMRSTLLMRILGREAAVQVDSLLLQRA